MYENEDSLRFRTGRNFNLGSSDERKNPVFPLLFFPSPARLELNPNMPIFEDFDQGSRGSGDLVDDTESDDSPPGSSPPTNYLSGLESCMERLVALESYMERLVALMLTLDVCDRALENARENFRIVREQIVLELESAREITQTIVDALEAEEAFWYQALEILGAELDE
jgi:hypothetical protein